MYVSVDIFDHVKGIAAVLVKGWRSGERELRIRRMSACHLGVFSFLDICMFSPDSRMNKIGSLPQSEQRWRLFPLHMAKESERDHQRITCAKTSVTVYTSCLSARGWIHTCGNERTKGNQVYFD